MKKHKANQRFWDSNRKFSLYKDYKASKGFGGTGE